MYQVLLTIPISDFYFYNVTQLFMHDVTTNTGYVKTEL